MHKTTQSVGMVSTMFISGKKNSGWLEYAINMKTHKRLNIYESFIFGQDKIMGECSAYMPFTKHAASGYTHFYYYKHIQKNAENLLTILVLL